jgi:hypothetical protein
MSAAEERTFWETIDRRIEEGVRDAMRQKREVRGIRVIWHLFIAPFIVFAKSFFLSSNIAKGRAGFRNAVHSSIFHFTVNARLYELDRGDRSELEKIKSEW